MPSDALDCEVKPESNARIRAAQSKHHWGNLFTVGRSSIKAAFDPQLWCNTLQRPDETRLVLRRHHHDAESSAYLDPVERECRACEQASHGPDALDQLGIDSSAHRTGLNKKAVVANDVCGAVVHPPQHPQRQPKQYETNRIETPGLAEPEGHAHDQYACNKAPPDARSKALLLSHSLLFGLSG
ncbi:MAG TPA: hypothetical protein VNJ02_09345 [Vicinamibacterales bacterium]|nr:hypothetical protein [Vicinamibacterales bacterium]